MTELWVTSIVVGSWVLVAGLAGFVGSFLVQRLGDRQLAMRVAKERSGPSSVERPVTAEHGVERAATPPLAFAGAGAAPFADSEMAGVTSTAA